MTKLTNACPLCHANDIAFYFEDKRRRYNQCNACSLVFVSSEFLPTLIVERAEYDLHENSDDDQGYRAFLQRALSPLIPLINPNDSALDFGCGPSPVLANMLKASGLSAVDTFDIFYNPDKRVFNKQYNIITCTEAIEHFHTPSREWNYFLSMLMPGGLLVIMTKRVIDKAAFARWHYKNDKTHVSFFSEATFHFLGERDGFTVEFPSNDVVLLKKL